MIGLRLVLNITLLLGGLLSPVAVEAQQVAKTATWRPTWPLIHNSPRASVKDCVPSVTSRAATS